MLLKRGFEEYLSQWATSRNRRPLIVRGARQVGKSTLIEAWGKAHFDDVVVIDFEQKKSLQEAFLSLDPKKIVETLSLVTGRTILPGKSLLFLDEIQEAPAAITALRYFFEQMPELHVIGAGSLLEMILRSRTIEMPVGRVEFLHVLPLSFGEFLDAVGEDKLRDYLARLTAKETIAGPVHRKLLDLHKTYALIGGMPAVVEEYASTRNMVRCRELQNSILLTYRNDFGKYASLAGRRYLEIALERGPLQIGRKLTYSVLDPNVRSASLKEAIETLCLVGVMHRVHQTSGGGLPLEAGMKPKNYKILFMDTGLMQRQLGLEADIAASKALLDVYRGAVAEQAAGQEMLSSQDPTAPARLYYWAREARGSKAEVDYLLPIGEKAVPVEVKAGSTGSLKSLRIFMTTYSTPLGIRISEHPLSLDKDLLSVPLYLAAETSRLAGSL